MPAARIAYQLTSPRPRTTASWLASTYAYGPTNASPRATAAAHRPPTAATANASAGNEIISRMLSPLGAAVAATVAYPTPNTSGCVGGPGSIASSAATAAAASTASSVVHADPSAPKATHGSNATPPTAAARAAGTKRPR